MRVQDGVGVLQYVNVSAVFNDKIYIYLLSLFVEYYIHAFEFNYIPVRLLQLTFAICLK